MMRVFHITHHSMSSRQNYLEQLLTGHFQPKTKKELINALNDVEQYNYQGVETWDVSLITDMSKLFKKHPSFNQPLEKWDVSNVTDIVNTRFKSGGYWGSCWVNV